MDNSIVPPASRICIGQVISRIFPNVQNRRISVKGIETPCYTGLTFNNITHEEIIELDVPSYVTVTVDNGKWQFEVPKNLVHDDQNVQIQYVVQDGVLSVIVLGKDINPLEYGLNDQVVFSQVWLNGLIVVTEKMRICKGLKATNEVFNTATLEQHEWNTIEGQTSDKEIRINSHNCMRILKFCCNYDKEHCSECNRELKQLQRRKGEKKVPQVVEVKGVKEVQTDPVDQEIPDNETIVLSKNDHEDLITIIEKLLPDAPNFKDLLRSQLKNAVGKDPRARRWDTRIISLCLSLWAKCPNAYRELRNSKMLILPSQCILAYHKNKVQQTTGVVDENIQWMYQEFCRLKLTESNKNGGITLDEMSLQKDLQVIRRGDSWEMVGAVDLGDISNNLETIGAQKKQITLATHALQYMFVGYAGFRWPIAFYSSNNANPHSIYFTFWEVVNAIREYDFVVDYVMLDGSAMNHAFTNLMFPESPRMDAFTTRNPFHLAQEVVVVQDIKHVLKKVRNSIYSSRETANSKRCLQLDGANIVWEHFLGAYEFNKKNSLRIYPAIRKDHMFLNSPAKMRNHLALQVLNTLFLDLMKKYAASTEEPDIFRSTIALLENTSVLVDVFEYDTRKLEVLYDSRIHKLRTVLQFFDEWEHQFSDKRDIRKHLISAETRQDIQSSILGFLKVVEIASAKDIAVTPTNMNQDILENWFCICRGIKGGCRTNPSLLDYSRTNNSSLLAGTIISANVKRNASSSGCNNEAAKPLKRRVVKFD